MTASWRIESLGDICKFKYGKSLKSDDRVPGVVEVMGSNGRVGWHDQSITAGPTVVVGRKGSIGQIAYSRNACWPIDTTYYIDSSTTKQDLRWLYWTLQSVGLTGMNKSAAVPGLNREDAYRVRIPLPPLPEQRRIADILDRADDLRAQRRRTISLINNFTEAAFDAFLFEGIDSNNRTSKLGQVAEIQTGPFGSLLHREDYISGGIPLINPTHIKDGRINIDPEFSISDEKFESLKAYEVREGDVVLGRRGEMGRAAEVTGLGGKLICGTGSMILRPKDGLVTGAVLAKLLRSEVVRKQLTQRAQGVTMLNLNQSIVAGISVALPSFESQIAFANSKTKIEEAKARQSEHLNTLDELFGSLQHRAFRGEL